MTGARVCLRAYRPDDAEALASALDDPGIRRFGPPLLESSTAERFLTEWVPAVEAGGGTLQAIADPVTGVLLGGIGLDRVDPLRRQAEVTFWVGPWARRRGVATAALRTLSDRTLGRDLERLELLAHWDDPVAQRVALAAGYQREGVRRGVAGDRTDMLPYARLATDSGEPAPRLLPDLPGGELTDGVVRLRPLGPDDLLFLTELRCRPEVVATSVPPEPPSPERLRQICFRAPAHWLAGTRADLVVEDARTGAPAGEIGLFYDEPVTGQAMIGYSVLPAYRGRGFATRAAQLLSLWAFAETGVARLIAGADVTNLASQRVLEKAGFHREAYLRSRLPAPDGGRADDVQFVLLAEDLLTEGPRLDG